MALLRRRLIPLAAACALFSLVPDARADHEGDLIVLLAGTGITHSTLLPGYISLGVYAKNSEERMPIPWTVMNSITGAMGASFGVFQFVVGVSATTGSSDRKQIRPFNMAAGGLGIAGSAVVITGTILQTARPKTQRQAMPLLVLPMPIATGGGTGAGVMAMGCF